jgi:RimJ/RimL family protein N-acetyltransferase
MKDLQSRDFQVVPIAEKHIESYYECLNSVARERRYLAFVQAPPKESVREYVLSSIEKDIPQFVATKENEVIGWCDITPMRREGFRHCGELGMGVRDGFRRMGVGTRLVDQTIQKTKEQGIERVELEVFGSNIPAIRLYEKMGFTVEGVKKKARKLDGIYDDLVVMAMFI